LTAEDLNGDGKSDLIANAYNGNGFIYQNVSSQAGPLSFTNTGLALSPASTAYSLVVGDLDLDGRPDIVRGGDDGGNIQTIYIFRNTSTSSTISFATAVNVTSNSTSSRVIVIGDIDGDGRPDLITANDNANHLSILRNATTNPGAISFTSAYTFAAAGGSNSEGVALADFNGDGKLDLAIGNYSLNTISVLPNIAVSGTIGSGSFGTVVTIACSANPRVLAAGDVNGDGLPDLVAVSQANPGTLMVFYNKSSSGGGMAFTGNFTYSTGANVSWHPFLALGDLNTDGMQDIVTVNRNLSNSSSIAVFLNKIITPPIFITDFTPKQGTLSPTTTITITGSGFNTTSANNVVFFGTARALTVTALSSTQLQVVVPTGANYQYISVSNLVTNQKAYSEAPFVETYETPVGSFN
jgi:hypothetical protein